MGLIMMPVLWVYTYLSTHKVVCIKYVQFFVGQSKLKEVV